VETSNLRDEVETTQAVANCSWPLGPQWSEAIQERPPFKEGQRVQVRMSDARNMMAAVRKSVEGRVGVAHPYRRMGANHWSVRVEYPPRRQGGSTHVEHFSAYRLEAVPDAK
jgi:hypothetical protein